MEKSYLKKEIAEEIFALFIKRLPQDFAELKIAKEQNDSLTLLRLTHKLHGALCYCDIPKLKKAVEELECALKLNQFNHITSLFNILEEEVNATLD